MTNTSVQIGTANDWFIPSIEELKIASSFIEDSRIEILHLKQYSGINVEVFWSSTMVGEEKAFAMSYINVDEHPRYYGLAWLPVRAFG